MIANAKSQIVTPDLKVPPLHRDASSSVLAFFVCLTIVSLLMFSSSDFMHWFILPTFLCGVLISIDAVDWLRGRMDLMDPVGWVGLFGIHFFFIAPLLIIQWDHQMLYLPPLEDWRPWLGRLGIMNLVGLVLYRISRTWVRMNTDSKPKTVRVINYKILFIVLYFTLGITFALQILVYAQSGGLLGYITAYETRSTGGGFEGFGMLFAFSESFPLLLLIALVIHARHHENHKTWFFILLMLSSFFIVRIFFGGLRGSRSNTIYAMIWAIGVIHLWIRPLPRRFLVVGAIGAILFLYIMGFYKSLGSDFGRIFDNPTQLILVEQETGRSFEGAMIGDLSRADVQAYMLHNLNQWEHQFPYAWGRTYFAGYTIIIPSAIWRDKPPSKVMEGTQVLLSISTFEHGVRQSSRVYGLMGEAILNFGTYFAPLMFLTLGLLVGLVRRWYYNLHPDDAFRLWIPFLIILSVTYIVSDSDNNAVSLIVRPLAPAIVLWLGSRTVSRDALETSHI